MKNTARALDQSASGKDSDGFDVVIVGSGAAGFSAAVAAAMVGARVCVLEKAEQVGGTTSKAGGGISYVQIWIPANHHMRAHGLADPRAQALQYMARLARPSLYEPDHGTLGLPPQEYAQIAAFFDNASEAIELLENAGAIHTLYGPEAIDYAGDLPENAAPFGRALHIAGAEGQPGSGADLIESLHSLARRVGVDVRTSTRVTALLQRQDGRVAGVETADGERISAGGGVVFATGGFAHEPNMVLNFLRGPVLGSAAVPTNEGDFLRIAQSVGASLWNMNEAWLAPIVLDHAPYPRGCAFRLPGDGMLVVNRHGVRVVNEKTVYNELTRACWTWDPHLGEYSNLVLIMVYDAITRGLCQEGPEAPIAQGGGNPIADAASQGHEIEAPTLGALAERVDVRLRGLGRRAAGVGLAHGFRERLAETVNRFGSYAASGLDPEFARGSIRAERERSGPALHPESRNPTMRPLYEEGPYYAAILGPGMLDTRGGPLIDDQARILGIAGQPIIGLYGAGNCVASPTGQGYWGGGATLGPAITFGVLAGRHAAREARSRTS